MRADRTPILGRICQLRVLIPLFLFSASVVGTAFLHVYEVSASQAEGLRNLTQANTIELFRLQSELSDLLSIKRMDLAERRLTETALDPKVAVLVLLDAQGRVLLGNHAEWKGLLASEALPGFHPGEARQAMLHRSSRVHFPSLASLQSYAPLDAAATSEQLRPENTPLLFMTWDLAEPLAAIQRRALEEALASGAINLLLAGGLAFLLHRMMIQRLQSLTDVMTRVGKGDLEARVATQGGDEISELGRSFDAMTAQLQRQHLELLASEARFRKVLEHSPIPVAVCDSEGAIEFLSESFVATYGFTQAELPNLERWWALAFPDPAYRSEVQALWEQLAEGARAGGGDIPRHECSLTCKDGRERIVEIQGTLMGPRILATFNDISDRVEAEQARARKGLETREPVDLNELVRQESELLSHTTLQRVQLDVDLAPDLPLIIGDPSALASSLLNLCINAAHAMPEGGTLSLRTRAGTDGSLELSVADTGSGIPPNVRSRIFDPFFTTKALGKGSGLGLALVAATVRAHGGTISVDSAPGLGSCFTLRFPVASFPKALNQDPPVPVQNSPGRLQILLVDDDELIRQTAAPLLEALGHDPQVVASMAEAFATLKKDPFIDLILLDNNMPGMTGAEGLPILRSRWPDIAVIMISGYVDPSLGQTLQAHPEVPLVPKPFGSKELSAGLAAARVRSSTR